MALLLVIAGVALPGNVIGSKTFSIGVGVGVGVVLFTSYVVRIIRTEVHGEEADDLRETVARKSSPRS